MFTSRIGAAIMNRNKTCHAGDGRPVAPPSFIYCRECLLRIGKGEPPNSDPTLRTVIKWCRKLAVMIGKEKEFDAATARADAMSDAELRAELRRLQKQIPAEAPEEEMR